MFKKGQVVNMKKEDFLKLGVDEELAGKLAEASAEELKAFIPKTRFDEVNNELKANKEIVAERDKQLEELKKSSGDNEALKAQIADLQKANKESQAAHEAEMNKLKLDNAVDAALLKAGAKNSKAVRALFDESKFKLNAEGDVEGLEDALKAVQKSDSYLFEGQKQVKGFHPGEGADPDYQGGKPDFSKMNYSELAAYMEANPGVSLE